MFVASRVVTSKLERRMPKPKSSTIQEHFRKLIGNCRATNRTNMGTNGISGTYGDLEQNLDAAIQEIDDKKKLETEKKKAEEKKEAALKAAANDIRKLAPKNPVQCNNDTVGGVTSKKRRKLNGIEAMCSLDTELKHLLEQDKERNANESKRLKLEE